MKQSSEILFHSTIRTFVPILVGSVVGFLVSAGIIVPEELELALDGFLTVAASTIYYGAVRLLETKFSDKWGWLLGSPHKPTEYSD